MRVSLAGVCNTDLELVRGYYPYTGVPGHEFVGVVERADGAPEWVGRRVVGEINAACGACATCLAGRRTHCERRSVLGIVARDGAFATHLVLPVGNLHAVPEGVPDEVAVFTEPTAAALELQEQVRVSPGDRVVVIGAGKLGNLVAQTLAATGCRLLAVGRSPRPSRAAVRARHPDRDGGRDRAPAGRPRGGVHREPGGPRAGPPRRAPARHDRAQEHVPREGRDRHGPLRRRRDHPRRLALRAVRPGPGGLARGERGPPPARRGPLPSRGSRGRLRPRREAGRSQDPASTARRPDRGSQQCA